MAHDEDDDLDDEIEGAEAIQKPRSDGEKAGPVLDALIEAASMVSVISKV